MTRLIPTTLLSWMLLAVSAAGASPPAATLPAASAAQDAEAAGVASAEGSEGDSQRRMDAGELLAFAFETASAIPSEPHLRDRSRSQERVVVAAIELGRLDDARRWLPAIEGWRRGVAAADLAYAIADAGDAAEARRLLATAAAAAAGAGDWQSERVLMRIAQVEARLGGIEAAEAIADSLAPVEGGKVRAEIAERLDAAQLDEEIARIEAAIAAGQRFDEVGNAVDALIAVHRRVYGDAPRRERLEQAAEAAWRWIPLRVRMEKQGALLRNAIAAGDEAGVARWLAAIAAVAGGYDWAPEDRVPILAELARWRLLAGDLDGARAAATESLEVFSKGRDLIIDVFRGEALRPLAESFVALGDREGAAQVYALALDEAFVNPNARPRAIDLSAAATSMARSGFEPDAATADRLTALRRKLDHPW